MTTRNRRPAFDHAAGSQTFAIQEVCASLIDGAIALYVRQQNIIATHVLASAAHEKIRSYAKKHKLKLKADIHAAIKEVFPQEYREILAAINMPYNEMKHGGESEVTVHPRFPEGALYMASWDYIAIFGPTPPIAIFLNWMTVARPDFGSPLPPHAHRFASATQENKPLAERLKEARELLEMYEADPASVRAAMGLPAPLPK